MRVIHAPSIVAGNAIGLSRAERSLGLESTTISILPHAFGYQPDITWATSRVRVEFQRRALLGYVLENADVVHFNFGSSLYPRTLDDDRAPAHLRAAYRLHNLLARPFELKDLATLRAHGIGIVVTFQGDDARQGTSDRHLLVDESGNYGPSSDAAKARRIRVWDEFAHSIFALNPDLLDHLPPRAQFLPYSAFDPRAIEPKQVTQNPAFSRQRPMRVVHAPSDRRTKGTRYVTAAIEALQREGLPIELQLVEGMSHDQALAAYRGADILLDQLLTGWYGGLAVECMAMGVPALAYVDPRDLDRVPAEMAAAMPVMDIRVDNTAGVLRKAFDRLQGEGASWSQQSRTYVENFHDPHRIARELITAYEAAIAAARS
jgi:hypothetical protein